MFNIEFIYIYSFFIIYVLFSAVLFIIVFKKKKAVEKEKDLALEEQKILNKILELSLANVHQSRNEKLEQIFDVLFQISWLPIKSKGGLFLREDESTLKLVYSRNLGPTIENLCSKVKKGECLCGMAFLQKKIQYASCIDERHTTSFEGIEPHGHYNIPINNNGKVLGVIVLYLDHGHVKKERELHFLRALADILMGVLLSEQYKKKLVDSRAKAVKANHLKNDFLASIGHEIFSPINGVLNTSIILMKDLKKEKRGEADTNTERVEYIYNCSSSLLETIGDILNFSKLQARHLKLTESPFNVFTTTRQLCDIYQVKLDAKNIKVNIIKNDLSEQQLLGDESKYQQILNNILNNAITFSNFNSEIIITLKLNKHIKGNPYFIEVEVQDFGIGVTREKLFEIEQFFSSQEASENYNYNNLGVGLIVCRDLVYFLNGKIDIVSEVNKGTTLRFSLEVKPLP